MQEYPPMQKGGSFKDVWDAPCVPHRFPRIADLRADPFERGSVRNASMYWQDWQFRRAFVLVPAQGIVGGLLKSFAEYPPGTSRLASVSATR